MLIKEIDDKRQIAAMFAVTMAGKFLTVQVIYEGKTHRLNVLTYNIL